MQENPLNYIPLKMYRYLRWRQSEEKAYRFNKKYFSKEYADICFHAAKLEKKKKSAEEIHLAYHKKDQYILCYLKNICGDIIEKYRKGDIQVSPRGLCKKIWVFWWSGEESAPEIVKICIKSIRTNANGQEVVILDKDNYQNYVTLPDLIIQKHKRQEISHAHFSDLLRLTLLSTYGGLWIDATVFLSQPIPEYVFNSRFYTLKTVDKNALYYSKSQWVGYFLAGDADFLLYSFARDFLLAYWERSERIIDYLLMDYVFGIAYQNFDEVKCAMDQLPDNNFKRGILMNRINEPYSKELFEILATKETFASKLSWRYGNPKSVTLDGEITNFGYLLNL